MLVNQRLKRTELVRIEGIATVYADSITKQPLDISRLTKACWMAPDAYDALKLLDQAVKGHGGLLVLSDVFRSWDMQKEAHDAYVQGKRKAYATPPGYSWHEAGRAVDIAVHDLNFPKVLPRDYLPIFWSLAKPLGWRPIVRKPNPSLSESWHFEFPGKDWTYCYVKMGNRQAAISAIVDCGQYQIADDTLKIMYLQTQLNRLGYVFVQVDGIYGGLTRLGLSRANVDVSGGIDKAISILEMIPTPNLDIEQPI